jgi:hypothetical protein
MNRYVVSCTISTPGYDGVAVTEAIERLGTCRPCSPCTWILVSNLEARAIRDALKAHLGPDDELFVGHLSGEAAWRSADARSAAAWQKVFAGERQP